MSTMWDKTKKVVVASAGAGTALTAAPTVASVIGFKASGIAAGSYAAGMMSALGGAATPAGGIVATLQTVGATGTIFVSAPAVIVTCGAGVVLGGAGYATYRGIKYFTQDKETKPKRFSKI